MDAFRKTPVALTWLTAILLAVALAACGGGGGGNTSSMSNSAGTLPASAVSSTSPANGSTGVGTNTKITATFSTPMGAASISASTFTVNGPNNTGIAGTVSFDATNNIASFAPNAALAASTTYTATLTTGVMDQTGNALAANYAWTFTTGSGADTTAPQVTSTSPGNLSVGVATNATVTATFTKVMDASSITSSTFTILAAGNPVTGTVTYSGTTATFTPSAALAANTLFTATIAAGAKDLAGNLLGGAFVWTFTTGGATNTTLPAVRATNPANQATGVGIGTAIGVTFSEAMNASTITTASFTLTAPGGAKVAGTVTAAGNAAAFTPSANLLVNSTYIATIGTAVKDLSGNALPAAFSWSFTTGASPDTAPPTVLSTTPASGASAVFLNQAINVTFSEAMNPATISNAAITLMGPGSAAVAGTVTYYAGTNVAAFVPSANLAANTIYTATVSTGVADLNGNALAAAKVWSFTTGSITGGTAPVNLHSLTTFALVAGSGLSSSNSGGQTTINGNVGLSPVVTCTGDGAPCSATDPIINGALYANDTAGVAAMAKTDLIAASADGSGRPPGAAVTDVTGMTLQSGVYTAATGLSIASGGTLTLDAGGDPNAVWIFQVTGNLTINSNAQIVLANGAKASNVFWVSTGAANLGSNVIFSGNVLAGGSASAGTGSVINGRLLANTGQVTLIATTLTAPGP